MTDIDIIRLLWIRDEIAIEELEINYGHYCRQISWEIVQNREDVSECLNDTWWKTWCSRISMEERDGGRGSSKPGRMGRKKAGMAARRGNSIVYFKRWCIPADGFSFDWGKV